MSRWGERGPAFGRMKPIFVVLVLAAFLGAGAFHVDGLAKNPAVHDGQLSLKKIPKWDGKAYVELNGGLSSFSGEEMKEAKPFTDYSPLDDLGRAGLAEGCLGPETIHDGEREPIGHIRPSGWHTVKYPRWILHNYLYNRCHLLMHHAAAGLDPTACNSEQNLITGTRYMNEDGMLPFEESLANYIQDTGNHVFYRVTPVYEGDDAVARGVHMEARSVEDDGKGIQFNVFCYNVQPGISIDYANGESSVKKEAKEEVDAALSYDAQTVVGAVSGTAHSGSAANVASKEEMEAFRSTVAGSKRYVLNTSSKKIHLPDCPSVSDIYPKNKMEGHFSRKKLILQGYSPCGACKP